VKEIGLDGFQRGRDSNDMAKKTVAILATGAKLLKSSTITTFNKKVRRLHEGFVDEGTELDVDDLPALGITFESPEGGGDSQ
jgi:hypothetical protein